MSDTIDIRERQFPQFLIPISQEVVRTGIAADKILDLLCQRRRPMRDNRNFFLCVFVDNEFVFHRHKSLLFFHLPEEAEHSNRRYYYAIQNNRQDM